MGLPHVIQSQQLPPALAHLLSFSPPCFGSSRNRSCPGSTPLNPSLLRRFNRWCCLFDLCPGGGIELPFLLGGFSFGSFSRPAEELSEFLLQRLDAPLEVGCFTQLLRC